MATWSSKYTRRCYHGNGTTKTRLSNKLRSATCDCRCTGLGAIYPVPPDRRASHPLGLWVAPPLHTILDSPTGVSTVDLPPCPLLTTDNAPRRVIPLHALPPPNRRVDPNLARRDPSCVPLVPPHSKIECNEMVIPSI